MINKDRFWNDPVDITKDQWVDLLKNEQITTKKDRQLLEEIYMHDEHKATCGKLAQIFNVHHGTLNLQVGRWGEKIAKKLNINPPPPKAGDTSPNWWNNPFLGESTRRTGGAGFYWILRPELKEALDELNQSGELRLATERNYPEDILDHELVHEGAKMQVWVNKYERDGSARKRCIQHYGAICSICNFDFSKTYGSIGDNAIHVHHLKPLAKTGETCNDPIKDLRPICPNCHLIVHRKDPPYSIEEVITRIKKQENK